jgi:hypothetical protein
MKGIITAAVHAGALAVAGSAQASPIRECGNFAFTSYAHNTWTGHWTFRTLYGFSPAANLTTRNVSCSDARWMALYISRVIRPGGILWSHFFCSLRTYNGEDYDIRCVRSFHAYTEVVRWQGGV